jgi:hypothetical protein
VLYKGRLLPLLSKEHDGHEWHRVVQQIREEVTRERDPMNERKSALFVRLNLLLGVMEEWLSAVPPHTTCAMNVREYGSTLS